MIEIRDLEKLYIMGEETVAALAGVSVVFVAGIGVRSDVLGGHQRSAQRLTTSCDTDLAAVRPRLPQTRRIAG